MKEICEQSQLLSQALACGHRESPFFKTPGKHRNRIYKYALTDTDCAYCIESAAHDDKDRFRFYAMEEAELAKSIH